LGVVVWLKQIVWGNDLLRVL